MSVVLVAAAACPYAGRYLVIDEPLLPSDAIFVLGGARAESWLEAVDLYRERLAPQIVLSPGIVEAAELRVREMGVRLPLHAELARDAMVQMGVPAAAITILASPVDNTGDEAVEAQSLATLRNWTSLIVVTSKYHTRRSRYAFEREFRDRPMRVQVRGSRYDVADPDRWWRHRADLRFVVTELQKLLVYRLGLDR